MAPGRHLPRPALVAMLVAVIGLVAAVLVVARDAGDSSTPAGATAPPRDDRGDRGDRTDQTAGTTSTTAAPRDGEVEVLGTGFSTYAGLDGRVGSYGLLLRNPGAQPLADVQVTVAAQDAAGGALHQSTETVSVIWPGATVGLGAEVPGPLPSDITALAVEVSVGPRRPTGVSSGSVSVSDVSVSSDEFGMYTRFAASSTYPLGLGAPRAHAVYLDQAGNIVGGSTATLDPIPAQGSVSGLVSSFTVVPGVARADVFVDPGPV